MLFHGQYDKIMSRAAHLLPRALFNELSLDANGQKKMHGLSGLFKGIAGKGGGALGIDPMMRMRMQFLMT